jgi:hypothetical protein
MNLHPIPAAVLGLAVLLSPAIARAATFGTLGNFDSVNDTGHEAHGFEIELEGIHVEDISDTFGGAGRGFPTDVERYGSPIISAYATGVHVTYRASFAAGVGWSVGTPSGTLQTSGESCWKYGGIGYGPSTPCDHFGVGLTRNPTQTRYSWLVETTPGSGVLSKAASNMPAPLWQVVAAPPPPLGLPPAPPVVIAKIEVEAGDPLNGEPQFGPAMWVKVFTTEYDQKLRLEELVGDNDKIKFAEQEIEWQLLQKDPGNPDSGKLEAGYGAPVGKDAESVVRRYEFYKYAGAFDPENHEAQVAVSDSHPEAFEIGAYMGAQNAAINLNGNPMPAVPEPETWAMLLGGLALVLLRRRHAGRTALA